MYRTAVAYLIGFSYAMVVGHFLAWLLMDLLWKSADEEAIPEHPVRRRLKYQPMMLEAEPRISHIVLRPVGGGGKRGSHGRFGRLENRRLRRLAAEWDRLGDLAIRWAPAQPFSELEANYPLRSRAVAVSHVASSAYIEPVRLESHQCLRHRGFGKLEADAAFGYVDGLGAGHLYGPGRIQKRHFEDTAIHHVPAVLACFFAL